MCINLSVGVCVFMCVCLFVFSSVFVCLRFQVYLSVCVFRCVCIFRSVFAFVSSSLISIVLFSGRKHSICKFSTLFILIIQNIFPTSRNWRSHFQYRILCEMDS